MINSFNLATTRDDPHFKIAEYDRREIDNPEPFAISRLNYRHRLSTILSLAARFAPVGHGVRVLDIGCAQGNASLLLAERGYQVEAVDLNPNFIQYAKRKHERGSVQWHCANVTELPFEPGTFDLALLGEIVEHCAYPERIVKRTLEYLKPGGTMIITTPNGSHYKNPLPTFTEIQRLHSRAELEKRQFGPDGEDHLFLFTLSELSGITPDNAKIVAKGYVGSGFLKIFPAFLYTLISPAVLMSLFDRLPGISRALCGGIYLAIQRTR